MISIQYQILRFLPDRVSGEFANLGIVAYDPTTGVLKSRFIDKIGKISSFFPKIKSKHLVKLIREIKDELENYPTKNHIINSISENDALEQITREILPVDDSALVFSEIKKCLDISIERAVSDLFLRFVGTHILEEDIEEVRNDKEVWNKVCKSHFDQYGISGHLAAHKVKTKNDELEFDKAWKNGIWNCFETVSFNLTRSDAIKNKVYKWVGKLEELDSSSESLHIYLLSVLPHEYPELTSFITKKIEEKGTENLKVDLVSEHEIPQFAKKIKAEIEQHS